MVDESSVSPGDDKYGGSESGNIVKKQTEDKIMERIVYLYVHRIAVCDG